MKRRFSMAAVAMLTALVAVPAAAQNPQSAKVVQSFPAKDDVLKEQPLTAVRLEFDKPVELVLLSIYDPSGEEISVYPPDNDFSQSTAPAKVFELPLPAALTEVGRYKLSYLVSGKSVKSLNGYIYFELQGKYPPPKFYVQMPQNGSYLSEPLTEIVMNLDQVITLQSLDLVRMVEVDDGVSIETVMETIATIVGADTPVTGELTGQKFKFPVDPSLTPPGKYGIKYSFTVSHPDGSVSETTSTAKFTVSGPGE
ncbi:copper resistance protein CopC [Blastomonas sp. AAP53]|uniref:copper resistance CopC family protein n=1 Tax=Blastomonas sp. AAP53 TaxID=1248760 RepID=UPI0002F13C07|nr:copper resistance protein CopC [Blastomonas sp. AAP53]